MDPDVLMNSMERITLLYKILKQTRLLESKRIITEALKYFLRETLPPAATLSRVVIEFLDFCRETERISKGAGRGKDKWVECAVLNAEVVFELPVLSGWLFEALCHLLNGKVSPPLLPYCVLTLLVSASSNQFIREIAPLCYSVLRLGFNNSARIDTNVGIFRNSFTDVKMSFEDRRLLCVVALKSGFSRSQLERLKELCD
ncbi:putative Huntington disease protein, partial [Operophtera brumata]